MKRYILFIVEGNNDRREIGAMLRASCGHQFLDKYVDKYHAHGGDITTEYDTTEKNVVNKLNDIVIKWRNGDGEPFQKISPADVAKIIHVVDTDGVFIPESSIKSSDDVKIQYYDSSIQCVDCEKTIGRNRKKARVIKKLLTVKKIDNIPYELFFVSCNMDHLLFDDRNPNQGKKDQSSKFFFSKCKERSYLINSVFADGICATGSWSDSWEMIQEGLNSLQRHTNLNLLLDELSE